jgi:anti-sigma factor RsiW
MTCSIDNDLGAYVLEALEPDESEAVQAHLAGCPVCRAEVDSLADTAGMLALLTIQDIEQLFGPESVADTTAPARPRRHRRGALVLAAAAVIAAMTLGGAQVLGGGPGPSPAGTVKVVDPTTHVQATVTVTGRDGGAHLHLALAGAYPSGSCSLVAHARDGRTESTASWVADSTGAANVDAMTAIPASQLSELDVLTTTGVRLVRINLPNK